jgi:hypothetical protein
MGRVQRQIDKTLKEVERIHSLLHPSGDPDPKQNLFQARSRREDAVRVTVLQMSLGIEDLLDGLFWRVLAGHDPSSKKRKSKKKGVARELDELLESGRLGFEAKIKLARVLRIVTKEQYGKLNQLRSLRNKCAHEWMLDIIRKRRKKPKPAKRLLEYEGHNLFDIKVLEGFMHVYSGIYLKLFSKYLS